ncbi:MAG: tetratricopeptide repeat protein [Planctomycetia bacterium]
MLRAGDHHSAIYYYTKVIESNPTYSAAYYNRGNAYTHIKEFREAVANFSRAIEIDPGMAAAYFNRATVFRNL